MRAKAWFFRILGNCFFSLNGGLEGIGKDNWLDHATVWAWSIAWFAEEKAAGRIMTDRG